MAHRPGSSSSSDFKHKWTHDVFLSFRGEDTSYGFTGNLYDALRRKEINTFIDDEKLRRGEKISPALLKAIEESRVSIVVFSENYTNSGWCLDELVAIIKCKKSKGQWVYPVFYNVDPSDVRNQRNLVGDALAKLQKKSNINEGRMNRWKSAMEELANLSGSHLKNSYRQLVYLEYLEFSCCDNLREIISIPPHLQYISAVGCPSLTKESSDLILNQGLNEIQNLTILEDGGDIPDWFDHCSKGGSLSFLVGEKFPVIALGSVLGAISLFFQLQFSLSINGIGVYVFEASFWTGGGDIVLLNDL
ncbi:Resistance protein [Quillaja saponaria]|uniref:ADP-ribosyl cyclase/cyclic ADP-ribose hydrolase n=1 Tax=Quillaja saponaria TaxID=32244 RepID=A0AAD7L146_QUISA|nr:Resistance protein [Quillaja saponaria]